MARIRTIKPEFFTSADIVALTPLARLFYVSLWCEADREGRLSWNPKTLKIRYFPVDDCSIFDLAQELIGLNLIEIYEIDGKEYAEIPSFKQHQVINNRESESLIPSRVKDACKRVSGEGRKEGRERKGTGVILPPFVDQKTFDDFKAHRKAIKKPMTDLAEERLVTQLEEFHKQGHDVNKILNESIMQGWQGVFAPSGKSEQQRPIGGNSV